MGKHHEPKLKPPKKPKKRKLREQPKFTAEMTRLTRIALVLAWARSADAVLIDGVRYACPDGWVDSWLLGHRSVGGASALRRLRELRNAPNVYTEIERRERTDASGDVVVEYRFARG